MSEQTPCARCHRPIDAWARICPYCSWDQTHAEPPAALAQQPSVPAYVPPAERNWRRLMFMAIGAVLLIGGAFAVGFLIHGRDAPENAPEPVTKPSTDAVRPAPHADVTLIPVTDAAAFGQPITSAPAAQIAEGVPNEYQRSDATAVASTEYAQLAQRAAAEKKPVALVDPRSISGPAYTPAPRPSMPRQRPVQAEQPALASGPMTGAGRIDPEDRARLSGSTRPIPEGHRQMPDIRSSGRARLELTVGADGRVKEVNILQGVPGQNARLIAAVQTWRFKPATENGVPVSAPYVVDLSFGNDE